MWVKGITWLNNFVRIKWQYFAFPNANGSHLRKLATLKPNWICWFTIPSSYQISKHVRLEKKTINLFHYHFSSGGCKTNNMYFPPLICLSWQHNLKKRSIRTSMCRDQHQINWLKTYQVNWTVLSIDGEQ